MNLVLESPRRTHSLEVDRVISKWKFLYVTIPNSHLPADIFKALGLCSVVLRLRDARR